MLRGRHFVLSCPLSSFTVRTIVHTQQRLFFTAAGMHLVHVYTVPGSSPPTLPPIVRPLNYPPIDCARIYSICNTTGVCGTAGADLQLHPMDGCITDRPTERPIDRPTERQIAHHHHHSLSRLSCCRWENLHLRTLSCSERAIGSRRNSFRLQVEVSMCRLQVAGAGLQVAERAGWLRGVRASQE